VYLVSGPNPVPDSFITASSSWIHTLSCDPWNARLNKTMDATSFGAWVAKADDLSPYIQVEISLVVYPNEYFKDAMSVYLYPFNLSQIVQWVRNTITM